jgi:hypothetical protein
MDIFELLRDENRAMLDEIRRLVIDYKTINNAEDIERSRHIFEILNEYIVIQNKMLYPKLPRQGEEDESIRTSKALLDEMDNIFEKSVMNGFITCWKRTSPTWKSGFTPCSAIGWTAGTSSSSIIS